MKTLKVLPRRDRCHYAAMAGSQLDKEAAGDAWAILMEHLEAMSEKDVPKFNQLMAAIRAATIAAKKKAIVDAVFTPL